MLGCCEAEGFFAIDSLLPGHSELALLRSIVDQKHGHLAALSSEQGLNLDLLYEVAHLVADHPTVLAEVSHELEGRVAHCFGKELDAALDCAAGRGVKR